MWHFRDSRPARDLWVSKKVSKVKGKTELKHLLLKKIKEALKTMQYAKKDGVGEDKKNFITSKRKSN